MGLPDTPDPNPVLNRHTSMFGVMGFATSVINNGMTRRPAFSGIHRHALAIVIAAGIGYVYRKYELRFWAEKDWYVDDYVKRHSEHFPGPEKKKVGELFRPWGEVK